MGLFDWLRGKTERNETKRTVLPCPMCSQQLRVPTDLGDLRLTCPRCGYRWDWNAASPRRAQGPVTTGGHEPRPARWDVRTGAADAPSEIAQTAIEVAKRCWGAQPPGADLQLPPDAAYATNSIEKTVTVLLNHVRRVARGIDVPMMTPRTVTVPVAGAAGVFRVVDGWVRIEVDSSFARDFRVASAILAHEAAHYVLDHNGIRRPDTQANERLTDVTMFVLGFGQVFLNGYRGNSGIAYRPGHRLGYLSDSEYEYLHQHVTQLRLGPPEQIRDESVLGRLWHAYPDKGARLDAFERERRAQPHLTDNEIVDRMLDDWVRRGR